MRRERESLQSCLTRGVCIKKKMSFFLIYVGCSLEMYVEEDVCRRRRRDIPVHYATDSSVAWSNAKHICTSSSPQLLPLQTGYYIKQAQL